MDLVAFRRDDGRAVVMGARCSHMGANLASGSVVGDRLQCPFHGWQYDARGACVSAPGCGRIPGFARQRVFPVTERHGELYFFNRPQPLYELPFFPGERPEDFIASRRFRFAADCTWFMAAAHAFDVQHFEFVHDRILTGPPVIDEPAPFARRNTYEAEVRGSSLRERLLRLLGGPRVRMSITAFGGTMFFLSGRFRRSASLFAVNMVPRDDGGVDLVGVVYGRRTGRSPWARLRDRALLGVRWLFTHGYLKEEARELGSPVYDPARLVEGDREMTEFFRWVVGLPGFGRRDTADRVERRRHGLATSDAAGSAAQLGVTGNEDPGRAADHGGIWN